MFRMWDVGDVGCWGCGMLGMWVDGDVGCWGCGIVEMRVVGDVGCSGCGMLGMWVVAGMWDVDLQNATTEDIRLIGYFRDKILQPQK